MEEKEKLDGPVHPLEENGQEKRGPGQHVRLSPDTAPLPRPEKGPVFGERNFFAVAFNISSEIFLLISS